MSGMTHTVRMTWGIQDYLGKSPNTAGLVNDILPWKDNDFIEKQADLVKLYKKENRETIIVIFHFSVRLI